MSSDECDLKITLIFVLIKVLPECEIKPITYCNLYILRLWVIVDIARL